MIPSRRHSPDTHGAHFSGPEANAKEPAMTNLKTLLIAAPVAMGLLAAPAAHAEWRGHGGWEHHGGWGYRGGHGGGLPLVGALLGAAVVGGIIASQPAYAPPPVYYAPPPAYYAPPAYAPAYYPQTYYAPPGY
jgi:hypothetical protein